VPRGPRQLDGHRVADSLEQALPGIVVLGTDEWVEVEPTRLGEALHWLRDSEEFDAAQLSSMCGVDLHDHFTLVYHLQSLDQNHQIVVKAQVWNHETPSLPSAYPVYRGALLQEREVYDLMGINFEGHPDMRRLFLWDGFPGHPLRKDFMSMGNGLTSGLRRFPFEDRSNPDRLINRDNVTTPSESQDAPRNWTGGAPT
jgi:NADH-quinone oxidoreductase subunit C